ncbi:hypothetical protein K491DRAFT_667425 [Lophiostoma macrostomum CBS 122681]|uniref:Uncharacterized protein n=1 Tax=Lophiostoma macrostomum CBS 122681 TaxID=1314788 RepID=A0A6A6STC9_9PLEO|nr:hypothetical protein K491DRAFT_667425 [Lophiostoma macrostomum CBS 122681]
MSSNHIQFVQYFDPHNATMKKRQQRVVHSNAARAAHAEARRRRTVKYQAAKARERSQQLVSPPEGVVVPSPLQISSLLPAGRTDPFASCVRPFTPVEHFLLDHFITAVVPLLRCHELASFYTERMTTAWVPLALTNTGLLDSVLLMACRHLSAQYLQHQRRRFDELSMQYKLHCLRSLREEIAVNISFDDATVAKTLMLVYDELTISDTVMAKGHLDGAIRMVDLNGGPQTLGMDGFINRIISNLSQKFEISDFKFNEYGQHHTDVVEVAVAPAEL